MAMPNDAGEHHGDPAAAADNLPTDAAPAIEASASSSSAHDGAHEERAKPEAAARPSPGMPRAAILAWRPDERPGHIDPEPVTAARSRAGGRRFAMLAAGLTLAAALGAVAGSAGMAGVERLFAAAPPAPAHPAAVPIAVRHEPNDEVRVLKESVAQLKSNVKSLNENVAALRATVNLSTSAANSQFTKISEALDRGERERAERDRIERDRIERERAAQQAAQREQAERDRVERRVTALAPSPEPTGSVPPSAAGAIDPKAVTKNSVIEGWSLRKVYGSDSALVEGRYGVVEIVPGDLVPGLGRIQEIKRQDGHWVVVTSRGLVVSSR
jgi:hypothetical protein